MDDIDSAWNELMALPRNDLEAALAWTARWRHVMDQDDGLGGALVRLFDDPRALLVAAAKAAE